MKLTICVLLVIAELLTCSWLLMLLLGVLHHELTPAIPAIGYWSAARIWLLVSLIAMTRSILGSTIKEIAK